MKHWTAAVALLAIVAITIGYLLTRSATAQAVAAPPRYSTQVLAMPPAVAITDHEAQKLYLYTMEKQELKLDATIDLSRAGEASVPVVEPAKPTTQPAP
jgi:hypothetical protein